MPTILVVFIVLIWLPGTLLRIYRQIRFYQIEEYKSNRYLRWLLSDSSRWLPRRPLAMLVIGGILGFLTDTIPGNTSVVPYIAAIITGLIAVWPPQQREIKKAFVLTARARRMLGAAFVFGVIALIALVIALTSILGGDSDRFTALAASLAGFAAFMLAPVWLMLGNHAMFPVEAAIRQRFIRQARGVLAEVQPKVIGITGSYGKTTTKNYLRDILNGRYKTYATPKSYNTMMGVTRAINEDMADDYGIEYFISEMGAYIPGEIRRICDLTPPHISIVVEVGPQHLERFGSLENIALAKYEIIKALPPDGLGVFNWDNPYVREMYERGYPNNRLAVSKTADPHNPPDGPRFIASDIHEGLEGLRFTIIDVETGDTADIQTPVVGEHNVTNLLLATAVAVHEGMSLRDVAFRARTLQPAESRLVRQTTDTGITIINDAYSANPVGVVSALRVLGMHQTGRRLLITPGMVELAHLHESENRKLGETAAHYATDIILVGEAQTRPIAEGVRAAGFPAESLHIVDDLSDAVAWYQTHLQAGDTVLFLNDLPDTY